MCLVNSAHCVDLFHFWCTLISCKINHSKSFHKCFKTVGHWVIYFFDDEDPDYCNHFLSFDERWWNFGVRARSSGITHQWTKETCRFHRGIEVNRLCLSFSIGQDLDLLSLRKMIWKERLALMFMHRSLRKFLLTFFYHRRVDLLYSDLKNSISVDLLLKFFVVQLECSPINGGTVIETIRHLVNALFAGKLITI